MVVSVAASYRVGDYLASVCLGSGEVEFYSVTEEPRWRGLVPCASTPADARTLADAFGPGLTRQGKHRDQRKEGFGSRSIVTSIISSGVAPPRLSNRFSAFAVYAAENPIARVHPQSLIDDAREHGCARPIVAVDRRFGGAECGTISTTRPSLGPSYSPCATGRRCANWLP